MNELNRQSSPGGRMWRNIYWIGAALLLTVPLFAMQVTDEVDWGPEDFVAGGIMFGLLGIGFELVTRFVHSWKRRLLIGGVLVFAFLFIWAEMAVGIVGSPIAGS